MTSGKSIIRLSFNRWFLHCRLCPTSQTLNAGNKRAEVILKDFTSKPKKCFGRTVLVRHGDSDWHYHTNQANYFDYCMDAATEGAKLGHFRLLKVTYFQRQWNSWNARIMEGRHQGMNSKFMFGRILAKHPSFCVRLKRMKRSSGLGKLRSD